MKWITADADLYLQSKEYVDTVIIPLIPISTGTQMKNIVLNGEFISILTNELERQFKGRVFLIPPFTYLKDDQQLEKEFSRLIEWKNSLTGQDFKHVVYITSDASWQQFENEMGKALIWLPAVPLEHVDSKVKQQIMTDQIQQIVPLLLSAWRN
ncbi:YpiF family protein [Bacillus pinisoli]|uniref:YpiF family protein n=1 Tax=Bacillus pinisoli TaxID=2901866 RepID=UPI001FF2D241|nr:YpiF family protein [Bacillus pinisoli]